MRAHSEWQKIATQLLEAIVRMSKYNHLVDPTSACNRIDVDDAP